MEDQKVLSLHLSASPHVRTSRSTRSLMLDVLIALLPALVASVFLFGLRALVVVLVSVVSCVGFEYLVRRILKRKNTVGDLSAVVTGLLLAFNLPVTLPLWMVVFAALVSIVVAKQFFGGIGQNFVNPALMGRIVLLTSFPTQMAHWTKSVNSFFSSGMDTVSTATPLAQLARHGAEAAGKAGGELPSFLDCLLGRHGGSLGETCILALLLGFAYLLWRRVIQPVIPLCFIGTVAVFMLLTGGFDLQYTLLQLMSGGLVLGAVFMATDYSTCPLHTRGKIIYAIGAGLITSLIRVYASLPEGVSFAIILMNLLVPLIELYSAPKPFGSVRTSKLRTYFGKEVKG